MEYNEIFRFPADEKLTTTELTLFLEKHRRQVNGRYKKLYDAYTSDHDILHQAAKPKHKPDNRIVVNFPKYITDTMNGSFIGNPIKTTSDDDAVSEFVEYIQNYNDQDDNNAELSKICSIYGRGYEMYYTDEESELCITYLSPVDAFMIYDESIVERPLYFVRRYKDNDGIEWGSISDAETVRYFKITDGVKFYEEEQHHFDGVPATEILKNEKRQGIFEPVM